MEGVSRHAASLLAKLNVQRGQAQFCDCVVRQRQEPGRLYPAHRCLLAASSPVLASILSSAGVLVELQAPCLSDCVLALLLDYVYTGALPFINSEQQYYGLLTAACHLQMDELQEALRVWQQTAADTTSVSSGTTDKSYKDIINTANASSANLPSSHGVKSLENGNIQYSACPHVNTCEETNMCRRSSKNAANTSSRKDRSPLNNPSTSCSVSESSVNTGTCRQVKCVIPQDLIQNIPRAAEVRRVSREDKGVQKDQFHSAGGVKPETWQTSTEEEPVSTAEVRTSLYCTEVQEEVASRAEKTQRLCLTMKRKAEDENRKEGDEISHSPLLHLSTSHPNVSSRCSSSSFPSSPHACCGAVPVIRHSSTAALEEMPLYHPVSQALVSSSRAPDSRSGSTDSESTVEGITAQHKNHHREQNHYHGKNKEHNGMQNWDYKDLSNHCTTQDLCYKSNANEPDIQKLDFGSRNTHHVMKDNDEHMDNGLSHVTNDNDHHADCHSIQDKNHTKPVQGNSVVQNKDCNKGLKYKTDVSFQDQLDCSDCHSVSMPTAAEELLVRAQDLRAVVPLPIQDAGGDCYCEDLCPEGEVKEEHSYSSRSHPDRQDSHCNLKRTDWSLNSHGAETSASGQRECDSNNKDAAVTDKGQSICPSVSTTPETSLENVSADAATFERHPSLEHESDTEITEPPCASVDDMSDPMYSVVRESYRGHLHYHCLPQEDARILQEHPDHKHLSQPDHSDQSSDEERVSTITSPSICPLSKHFATEAADQVLLLDISTKSAELLVSCKHRSPEREKWVAFGHMTKSWAGETNAGDRKSVEDQNRSGAEEMHQAAVVEGEEQTTTLTVCSSPSVPDTVQACVSSTLSACIPSTLSASMPTNISAHLSTPVHHPFQCSLCDRSFSQRGSLNRHVRSHLGVRPFPCPRCPMTFSRQYRVTEHMRVHQRCVLGSDLQKPPASSV